MVPPDVSQLSCDYCGVTFRIPLCESGELPRCKNHPERYGAGKCNDCGGEFCSECLQSYEFDTQEGNTELYLCPDCFRNRKTRRMDSFIWGGIIFAFAGVLFFIFVWPIGIVFFALGGVSIAYGASRKPGGEVTSAKKLEVAPSETEGTAEPSETDWEEADQLYGSLLEKYGQHWGISSGASLLEDEIRAYTWDGYTWPEAVRKVYERQKKKA
jgi:hypothetical protein